MRSGFPSTPPRRPSPYRQLGSGGQQPVRVQMILGLVVGLTLVAVPLYLWRHPEPNASAEPSAEPAASTPGAGPSAQPYVPLVDASASAPKVKLSPFKTLRCSKPGPGKTPPERCDELEHFKSGLVRAIRDNTLCAPVTKTGATVSVVLDIHFGRKTVKIFRGKSSTLPKARTRELFQCIKKSLSTPDWASIPHQHVHYLINVKATFPPSDTF